MQTLQRHRVRFGVLGPIELWIDGDPVPVDGTKQRTVLAGLLLAHGRTLRDDQLSAMLWGDRPPATAAAQLYTYVSRLRHRGTPLLRLSRRGRSYRLEADQASLDLDDFRRLSAEGSRALAAHRHAEAAARLNGALRLWRGAPLQDVTESLADAELPRMEELRLTVLEQRIAAELALGWHMECLPELVQLVHGHPFREEVRGQLMTALYRSNRRADALAVYEEGRRLLRDQLGVHPGERLRLLHHAMLADDIREPVPGNPRCCGLRDCLHCAGVHRS